MPEPLDPVVRARAQPRAVEVMGQRPVEDVVDQGGLPRSGHPRHADEHPQRDLHIDPLQVVLPGAADPQRVSAAAPTTRRHGNDPPAGEVLAGDRVGRLEDAVERAGGHHPAALRPRPGPDVHDPVGRPDRLLVVLDDQDGVPQIAQPRQRLDQPPVVPLVQADAGFVQHVQHAHQPGADLRRQPDPLRLAARQGVGRPVEGEVIQPDVDEKAEAGVDLLEHLVGDQPLPLGERKGRKKVQRAPHGQRARLRDRPVADRDGQALLLEPRAAALGTGRGAHVPLDLFLHVLRIGLPVPALQVGDDAFEHRVVLPQRPPAVVVLDPDLPVRSVEQHPDELAGQPAHRGVHIDLGAVGERAQELLVVLARGGRPGQHRAVQKGEAGVEHEFGIDLLLEPEPGAGGAGAVGRVERENPRLDLRQWKQRVEEGA